MLKSFPKILFIAFLAILFFQINSVKATCTYAVKIDSSTSCEDLNKISKELSYCSTQYSPSGYSSDQLLCCCDSQPTPTPKPASKEGIKFIPQVGIPGAVPGFAPGGNYTFNPKDGSIMPIAEYIRVIYNYAIGIIGILAAVVLMVGGVLWIVAGGNSSQISEAKSWIGAALTGLVLALTSYLILNTINPALVNLQVSKVPGVGEFIGGCCIPPTNSTANSSIDNSTEEDCKKITGSTFVKNQTCSTVLGSCEYTKTTGGSTCRNYIKEDDCRTKKGKFIARQTCPVYSCCSYSTGGWAGTLVCTDTFGTFTKEQCEITARGQSSTFINYEPDGVCSDTAGKGCEAR